MKIYLVKGYGYDGFELDEERYVDVYLSRQEAEKRVHEIAKDQRQFVSNEDGMDYYESFNYKNGALECYRLRQTCDLRKPLHKEAFVYLNKMASICNVDEFVPKIEHPSDAIKIAKVAFVEIEEKEIIHTPEKQLLINTK